jgi:hypothetical protein
LLLAPGYYKSFEAKSLFVPVQRTGTFASTIKKVGDRGRPSALSTNTIRFRPTKLPTTATRKLKKIC